MATDRATNSSGSRASTSRSAAPRARASSAATMSAPRAPPVTSVVPGPTPQRVERGPHRRGHARHLLGREPGLRAIGRVDHVTAHDDDLRLRGHALTVPAGRASSRKVPRAGATRSSVHSMPAQIAFMVMPFGRKPTGMTEKDVPAEVDFDALWERVYQPVLEGLGYRAVRADRDVGALIISQMIQRLAIADLVVADITLPNANVYYEVGVRHAAKETGCVLVGADWGRAVFDLDQMRALKFPLLDGAVPDETAETAKAALQEGVAALAGGASPVFEAVPGFPTPKEDRVIAFADAVAELSEFEAEIRAVRAAPDDQSKDRVRALLGEYGDRPAVRELVWMELLTAGPRHPRLR